MSTSSEDLAGKFLAEITTAIDKHTKAYSKDAFWYQFIVVLSAVCGLLSLIAGTATNNAVLAGIFGGVTTIGSFLTQTLHCVKAQGWQDRMKAELDGIRVQFVYEHGSAPTPEALADLSKQYRELRSKMSKEWERIISSQSGGLNLRLPKKIPDVG
jgi:uncharacterized membrane-anchored protein YhcB (DUF1043 family)